MNTALLWLGLRPTTLIDPKPSFRISPVFRYVEFIQKIIVCQSPVINSQTPILCMFGRQRSNIAMSRTPSRRTARVVVISGVVTYSGEPVLSRAVSLTVSRLLIE